VIATYLRGRLVFERRADGGEVLAPAGTGEYVRRGAARGANDGDDPR